MALPQKARLKNKVDIDRVFQKGKTIVCGFFFVRFRLSIKNHARATILIPARVISTAVRRNRLRRQFIHILAPALVSIGGFDILLVVTAKPTAVDIKNLKESFLTLISRIKQWSGKLSISLYGYIRRYSHQYYIPYLVAVVTTHHVRTMLMKLYSDMALCVAVGLHYFVFCVVIHCGAVVLILSHD